MLRDELNIKYLPESMVLRYLRNESSEEERYIVEKLRSDEINWENYTLVEKMFKNGDFNKSKHSDQEYKKFLEMAEKYHKPENVFDLPKLTAEPKAGQIWSTEAIPKLGGFEFNPVAYPKYVYILSNPQPYQLLDDKEYVKNYKEYFTLLVLPISIDTEYATHEDYIIEPGNSILEIEFMIETWLETNMIACNLGKYLGELSGQQIDELLSIYFAANSMEYDQSIYTKAKKGKFHDKDHGDVYDFQHVEEENVEYLCEPVEKLYEFLFIDENVINLDIYNLIKEPELALAAEDENVLAPEAQKIFSERVLFADNNYEIKLVVLERGQLFLRFKVKAASQSELSGKIIVKDKIDNKELQNFENIDLTKAISYLKINKQLKGQLIEFSLTIKNDLYFIKNVDFRNYDQP